MKPSDLVTLSSTHIDLHGDVVPLESLEHLSNQINSSTKGRLLIDHKRDIPPIGYWDEAIIVEQGGYHLLKARQFFYNSPRALLDHPGLFIAELDVARELARHSIPEKPTIVIQYSGNNLSS